MEDGVPVFRIHEEVYLKMNISEASGAEPVEDMISRFVTPFRLEEAPLLRAEMVKIGVERYLFMLDVHHIVADRASVGIMLTDFFRLLEQQTLPNPAAEYRDYAEWQFALYHSDGNAKVEQYWLDKYKEGVPLLELPTDYKRPLTPSYEGDSVKKVLDDKLHSSLHQAASEAGTTISMVLTAAFYILLSKLTSQKDIVVGCNVLGRSHADLHHTMGMFVNTLPIRSVIEGDPTFGTYLNEVKKTNLTAYDYQNVSFESLLDNMQASRKINRNPLFDVCFNMMNVSDSIDPTKELAVQGLLIKSVPFTGNTAKFDLTLTVSLSDEHLELLMEYRKCLFEHKTIEEFMDYYLKILEAATNNPDLRISDLSLTNPFAVIKQEAEDEGDFTFM